MHICKWVKEQRENQNKHEHILISDQTNESMVMMWHHRQMPRTWWKREVTKKRKESNGIHPFIDTQEVWVFIVFGTAHLRHSTSIESLGINLSWNLTIECEKIWFDLIRKERHCKSDLPKCQTVRIWNIPRIMNANMMTITIQVNQY